MILVTGANGLLGSYLVKELIRRGERVRGLRRAKSDLSLLGEYAGKVEWVEGDVRDIFSLEEAMRGVTKVYHAAALISMQPRDLDDMLSVNAEGTANVVNAALDSGIEKLLYVSSVAAFGRPEQKVRLIDENYDIKDSKNNFAYYKSKLYAERELWRGIAEGLNAVIINPSTILGGGFWHLTPNAIFDQVYRGLPFYTNGVNGFVDVRDVVEVAIRLMDSDISGEKFIVSAENVSFRDVMWMAADAMKTKRPYIKAGKLLGGTAWRLEAVRSLFSSTPAIITRDSVALGIDDFYYGNDKVSKTLNFKFRPIRKTIIDVAAVYLRVTGGEKGIWINGIDKDHFYYFPSVIRRLFYILNLVAIAGLIFSCLACYISPASAWPLSFLGLAFPVVVISVFLFLLIWAIWRQWMFWLNLAAILLSWPFIRTVVSLHLTTGEEKGIRLMSYNVKNFDLYNWSGNKETRHKIMKLIQHENPDIICFQEYYSDDETFRNTEYICDSLGYKYHYMRTTYDKWYKNTEQMKWHHLQWGLAVFSRYAIVDTGMVSFGNVSGNQCMYTDLSVDGKPLRIYNAHLQSIHLGYDDYDTIEELNENQSTNWTRLRKILSKMKLATAKRSAQAEIMHDDILKYGGKKIVCGDFNDAPVSYTYQTIISGLQDAFVQKGSGFGKSFATKLGIFRIDYVLPDTSIQVNSCRTIRRELSDHYPVVVTMSL